MIHPLEPEGNDFSPLLQGTISRVEYEVEGKTHCLRLQAPEGEDEFIAVKRFISRELFTSVKLEVFNKSGNPLSIKRLIVLEVEKEGLKLEGPTSSWRFYQNGWQSWSPSFARLISDGLYVDPATDAYRRMHQPHFDLAGARKLSSEWFTVVAPPEGLSLLLGFVTSSRQLGEISLTLTNSKGISELSACCYADGFPLSPGEKFLSEELVLACGDNPCELLEAYGSLWGERMQAKQSRSFTGWCTWYYFYGENTEEEVLKCVRKARELALPFEYIIVDDGYQRAIGDWLEVNRDKFPSGLKFLAEEIKRAGFRPALWVAPFAVGEDSRLMAEHPDWVLRSEEGEPVLAWEHWGVPCYGLDLSVQEVQSWLKELFHILRRDLGFEFFKLDFLFAGAMPGRRRNPRITRAQAVRQGLEAIREGAGDDVYLLGCGAPLGPSIGLVDAMRIGPDVHPDWSPFWRDLSSPSAENSIRNTMTRYFFHRRLWANDPDCVLVRTRDDQSNLVLNEVRSLVSIVGLSGGAVVDSDNLLSLRRGRSNYLRRILPPSPESATTVDLFRHEQPSIMVMKIKRPWGEWWVAGVLNWSNRTVTTNLTLEELGIPPGRYHVYNYWRGRYLGVTDGTIILKRHQPHETVLLGIRPSLSEPQLLSSTFHITQGGVEIQEVKRLVAGKELRLWFHLKKPGIQFGKLLFVLPEGWKEGWARVDDRKQALLKIAKGVVGLGFTLEKEALVEVSFFKE
ncbi:MAG: alpha-galactosidase [Anaerolineae bacterium]|nr:alpha-galactosidase [Anaerolineae bacterium]MDW8102225.1 alpha-galactosidase [Anaerolineae bacterium]